jgi:hypothetical protein
MRDGLGKREPALTACDYCHRRAAMWPNSGFSRTSATFVAVNLPGIYALASQTILGLGGALPLIMKWQPADFGSVGAFEVGLLGIGLALFRSQR